MTDTPISAAAPLARPRRVRGRDIHEAHRAATPLELLLDLSFVVAIALAASQLHHGVMAHHTGLALAGFVAAFVAIWWAWMNYTWFASAYDDDSAVFRLLTMLQMGGVLVFATGVPGLFSGDFRAGVLGYAIMRLALVAQWLLAARGDPARAATCRRYALGITAVQVLWIARLGFPPEWLWPTFVLFMLLELAVPPWAERAGGTPWHAHHIAERYSGLLIITLGEVVLGAANAVAGMWQTFGWTLNLALVGLGSTALVFALWWMYFLLPSGEALHRHRERSFAWGYGHVLVFVSAAAIGAGLEVVADVLKAGKEAAAQAVATAGQAAPSATQAAHAANAAHGVSPLYAITMVALAQGMFMVSLWAVYSHTTRAQARQGWLTLACVACVALGPLAVWLGAPLPWGLLLLTLGPAVAIVYNEHGRRHCEDHFQVR
ncbi:low temperature requirement protein A [Ottowia sp.]|uniref:low temperature requirement protein A n=1 Tax=Ottowia sp. TaxID=1898956 RepID=UPI002B6DEFDC|nr:low temperature requirement protein A [Ottowia sp.]HOB65923.1 low temperature requirement protein A [Ottowia sp.]HPZ58038.1 low temperature requirement protein A [Ottowia sp.]HQD48686.1 low temperature requirement protein A [Ottowia sp.]